MAEGGEPSRHDAHPFEAEPGSEGRCRVCGEARRHILHHPTRVRAARMLRAVAGDRPAGDAPPEPRPS